MLGWLEVHTGGPFFHTSVLSGEGYECPLFKVFFFLDMSASWISLQAYFFPTFYFVGLVMYVNKMVSFQGMV